MAAVPGKEFMSMRIKAKKATAIVLAAVMFIMLMIACVLVTAEAKSTPRNGKVTDKAGNTYIYKHGKLQTGWVHYKGDIYYAHKTKSYSYPKGSICKSTYRVRGHRMYFFDESGKRLKKNTRYIALNKASKSVHYIYAPGHESRRYRYNANHKRYQYLQDNGKWADTGNQCLPYGMIDWQR